MRVQHKPVRFCAKEGCGKPIASDAKGVVCREHMHTKGLCTCGQCTGKKAPTDDSDRRKITLPVAPWDRPKADVGDFTFRSVRAGA